MSEAMIPVEVHRPIEGEEPTSAAPNIELAAVQRIGKVSEGSPFPTASVRIAAGPARDAGRGPIEDTKAWRRSRCLRDRARRHAFYERACA